MSDRSKPISEKSIVLLIAAVQFVNVVDFMMVMPLGPDFAKALGIDASKLGMIAGAYTLSASVSGLLGAQFLERFGRRAVLGWALLGLSVGTAMGGLATGFYSLLWARMVAGFFGGPATSMSWAVVSDVIPAHRRGQAMGVVMTSVSVSQVLGLPLGLELAQRAGWRAPFFAVALLGLIGVGWAVQALPPLTGHLAAVNDHPDAKWNFLRKPTVWLSYSMTALAMMGGFILIPNISTYVQNNLGFPREHLKYLYLVGGTCSFLSMRVAGRAVDRFGSFRIGLGSALVFISVVFLFFVSHVGLPPILCFALFMVAMAFRNVAYNTLTSKVPLAHERARFQSLQSSVQHAASSLGAFLSSRMLVQAPMQGADGVMRLGLLGIPKVATVSMMMAALLPWMLRTVERRIRARDFSAPAQPVDPPVGVD